MNPTVEQFQQFRMDGNIVPHAWYQSPRLALKNGKPNLVAITLLADVIYWYRPMEIRDEASGAHLGYRQKFTADKLQKNYRKWGDGFGFTLRQVEDAMAFLKASGVITVERRNVVTEMGTFPNCAFIEPVFTAIQEITYPPDEKENREKMSPINDKRSPVKKGDPSRCSGRTSPVSSQSPSRSSAKDGTLKREHTKSLSETPKETLSGEAPPARSENSFASLSWDQISEEEQAPWLEQAEQELRQSFGLDAWLKTGDKARAGLRKQRATSLYGAKKSPIQRWNCSKANRH